jgi:hypothetical protein
MLHNGAAPADFPKRSIENTANADKTLIGATLSRNAKKLKYTGLFSC